MSQAARFRSSWCSRPPPTPPLPQHARNYMDQEPKLPTPLIDPSDVAAAILRAASQGGRATQVGAMSRFNSLASRLAPALADRMAARQADRQQREVPPRDPRGTLDRPGHGGRIHGGAA